MNKFTNTIKGIATGGLIVGNMVMREFVHSVRTGFENWEQEPQSEYNFQFGNTEDILIPGGVGICADGVGALHPHFSNLLLFARTGSFKTSGPIVSTCLRLAGESVVIFDPSRTVLPLVAPWLEKLNYQVHCIDFSDYKKSSRINILDYAVDDQTINIISSTLVNASLSGNKTDPFFVISAAALCSFLIRLTKKLDKPYPHMATVRHFCNALLSKRLNPIVAKYYDPKLYQEYIGIITNTSEKTLGSVVSTLQSALEFWTSENFCRITAGNDIDFASFRTRKQFLCITASTWDTEYYKPILELIITLALRNLMDQVPTNPRPIYLCVDEAASLSLSTLSQVVANTRKYGIICFFCYQSSSQLRDALGHYDANTVLANCSQAYVGSQDLETSRHLSALTGKTTRIKSNGQKIIQPLMAPEDFLHQKRNHGILFCNNKPFPIVIHPWFEQDILRYRVNQAPYEFTNPNASDIVHLPPLPAHEKK